MSKLVYQHDIVISYEDGEEQFFDNVLSYSFFDDRDRTLKIVTNEKTYFINLDKVYYVEIKHRGENNA